MKDFYQKKLKKEELIPNQEQLPPDVLEALDGKRTVLTVKSLEQRIIDWNRKRNELVFSINLEMKMLQEESREFMFADTLVDRLRELADFMFVWTGTLAKWGCYKSLTITEMEQMHNSFAELQTWAEDRIDYMEGLVMSELQSLVLNDAQCYDIIKGSLRAVLEANEAKTNEKDKDGKIIKGPDYVAPVEVIQQILNTYCKAKVG